MIYAAWTALKLFAKRLPWDVWAALGALAAMLALIVWYKASISEAAKEGYQQGKQEQREETLTTIIERAETANEVRETISGEVRAGSGNDLYAQCLRTARTPANCRRFLPDVQADQR